MTSTKTPLTFEEWASHFVPVPKSYSAEEKLDLLSRSAFAAGRTAGLNEAAGLCEDLDERSWEFSLTYAAMKIRALRSLAKQE